MIRIEQDGRFYPLVSVWECVCSVKNKGDFPLKKNVIFLTFTLLFCYFCFAYICAEAGVTATVEADFDEYDFPTAKPDRNFNFKNLKFNIPDSTPYCTIRVTLTSSNFKGYAANVGDSLENDLFFEIIDNHLWSVSEDGMTLTYEYNSTNNEIPKTIKVRCRDYGAHGSIQITANNANVTVNNPLHIPIDVNGNDIADGWEKNHGIYIPKKNGNAEEAIKKAAADDERGPIDAPLIDAEGNDVQQTCVNDGDGWSDYDEYRGVYTTFENNKPAGHTRLNPKIKDIMYTSHPNVKKYGTGALPNIEMHAFTHIDHRLYQKEMNDDDVNILDPFTNIYQYHEKTGEVSHRANVDNRIGRVNYNSNPGRDNPSVPGAISVWSIRIIDKLRDGFKFVPEDGSSYYRKGYAMPGSPSQYSLAVILTENMESDISDAYDRLIASLEGEEKEKVKDAKANHVSDAKEKLIPFTIGHEVGHCLNIVHCENPNCIMNTKTRYSIFLDGSFSIIKREYNKNKEIVDVIKNGKHVM